MNARLSSPAQAVVACGDDQLTLTIVARTVTEHGPHATVTAQIGDYLRRESIDLSDAARCRAFAEEVHRARPAIAVDAVQDAVAVLIPTVAGALQEDGDQPVVEAFADDEEGFSLKVSDVGNADRFVRLFAGRVRYCAELGAWFIYDDRRWLRALCGEQVEMAKRVARAIFDEARDEPDDDRQDRLIKNARRCRSERGLKALLELAKSQPSIAVTADQFDDAEATAGLLNCRNGVLDLDPTRLLPHAPEYLFTKVLAFDFEPAAPCERWLRFIAEIAGGDADLVAFLQRAVGMTLYGQPRERVLLVLHGEGANGKSTFLETLLELLGEYAVTTAAETLMRRRNGSHIRSDLVALKGARFVSASESEEGAHLDVAIVKRLTGGDTITARPLYAKEISFPPTFIVWLATNHRPIIPDATNSIWDRVKLVPFAVRFLRAEQVALLPTEGEAPAPPVMDLDLKRKLRTELPGILAWAAEGYRRYREGGLQEPEVVKAATGEYREAQDVFGHWLAECCYTGRPDIRTPYKALYTSHTEWCKTYGVMAIGSTRFGDRMTERGYRSVNGTHGQKYRQGIGLLEDQSALRGR